VDRSCQGLDAMRLLDSRGFPTVPMSGGRIKSGPVCHNKRLCMFNCF
jgi:hypothetical protein